jgi:hypothetical protein
MGLRENQDKYARPARAAEKELSLILIMVMVAHPHVNGRINVVQYLSFFSLVLSLWENPIE